MRSVSKDAVATGLIDITIFAYVGYLAVGALPVVENVRGVAALGLALGLASRLIGGRVRLRHQWVAALGGVASVGFGIGAFATQHPSFLALFMASIIGLWIAGAYARINRPSDQGSPQPRLPEPPRPQDASGCGAATVVDAVSETVGV